MSTNKTPKEVRASEFKQYVEAGKTQAELMEIYSLKRQNIADIAKQLNVKIKKDYPKAFNLILDDNESEVVIPTSNIIQNDSADTTIEAEINEEELAEASIEELWELQQMEEAAEPTINEDFTF